jgi:hypothetical protein
MASGDARPFPSKNVAYRATFEIRDADGDLVTGATGLDSEVSKDAGTFADCTNEATEIATSSGVYYLDLTATEMNADTVAVIVKTTSTGAKTQVLIFTPVETGDTNAWADDLLGRSVSNVEATASAHSLTDLILASGAGEFSISGATLTIKRTDGSTTHRTKTLTGTAGVDPVTAVT